MPIIFRCDNCRQKLSVSSKKAGTMLACPKCARELMVPIPEAKLLAEDDPRAAAEAGNLPPTREWNPDIDGDDRDAEERAWAATKELPGRSAPRPARETPIRPKPMSPTPAPAGSSEDEEEFTIRRPKADTEDMDLTPMVDVTFLLLIFFMITASFNQTKTIETPAPNPDSEGAQTLQTLEELEMTSIMVRIDGQDVIYVDDEPIDPGVLEDVLGDKLRAERKNEVIIQSHPKSRHESMVSVYDAATGAGMQNIRLAAPRSEE
jgi:biopolymer transport protein ExbD